jgi:hypothetical protein
MAGIDSNTTQKRVESGVNPAKVSQQSELQTVIPVLLI